MAKETTKTKPPMTRAQLAVTLIVAILLMIVVNLVLFLSTPSSTSAGERAALFGVKKIVVEGNTRYDEAAIIGKSGIRIGQSIFSLNKEKAGENVRQAFAFAEKVTVDTKLGLDTVRIAITEATPLGVIPTAEGWLLVSTTGRGLQLTGGDSEVPMRYLAIRGSTGQDPTVGGQALDKRSLTIVTTLRKTLTENDLGQLTEIDMTDKTDIRVRWNNQITFLVGNDDNLDHKASVIAATMQKVLADYGQSARGTLNVRAYSDAEDQKKYIVFRPEGLDEAISKSATATTTASAGGGNTATTAPEN
ncbi:MAG: cell division protein FtsQ/DivIB [Acutalibacteraceae bacterium]|jgi:cell division septal protein FtsQ